MSEMGIFDSIRRIFEKRGKKRGRAVRKKQPKTRKKKRPPRKEVQMPQPWSRVEKYKKVKTNNSSRFSY